MTTTTKPRIVRLRRIKTPMPPFVMVTWGVVDHHAGSRARPIHTALTRREAAAWVTEQGWRYLGLQEAD